jgi:phage/plasmid-like protein (TIGR03299 family)
MARNEQREIGTFLTLISKEGKVVTGAESVAEAVENLPHVLKIPAKYDWPTGGVIMDDNGIGEGADTRLAEGMFITASEHGALGHVGKDYTVVQDADAFSFQDPLIERGIIHPVATGDVHGGKRHWLLSRFNEGDCDLQEGRGNDPLNTYLLTENSHDGSCSLKSSLFVFRGACSNGQVFRTKLTSINLRHSPAVEWKMRQAKAVLGMADRGLKSLIANFKAMAKRKLTKQEKAAYISTVLGIDVSGNKNLSTRSENILAEVAAVLDRGTGVTNAPASKNTLWGVYQGVTEYVNHRATVRGHEGKRIPSIWFGAGSKRMEKAYTEALALVA